MMAHDMYIDFIEPHPTSDRFEYCSKVATKLMYKINQILKNYQTEFEIIAGQILLRSCI